MLIPGALGLTEGLRRQRVRLLIRFAGVPPFQA
jgi:hypothetical protein